jgi:O-acetyl-ADP-ribose deacetylase (regulator of RNase III)
MSAEQRQSYAVGAVELVIEEGDITKAATEAIANAANNQLWMGGGVAGAIKRAGGGEIEEEAVRRGPIPLGSAIETGAGKLPYKYVIHGAVMGSDLRTNAELIARTTLACLQLADQLAVSSLALPAFGTGVGGFSLRECGRIMARVAKSFATEGPRHLRRIVFVLWGAAAYEEFLAGAAEVLAAGGAP